MRHKSKFSTNFYKIHAVKLGIFRPKLNEYIKVVASVGEDISSIYYFISSKGLLLASDKLMFTSGKRTASIWFKPDFSYAPSCQVLAYYINKAGDFVVGSISVQINDKLPNYVRIYIFF